MPSWHSRRLISSPISQSTEADAGLFTKHGSDIGASTSAQPQHGRQTRPSPNAFPRHGRSHSHPFTSLFGSTKKEDNALQHKSTSPANNPVALPTNPISNGTSSISPEASKSRIPDKELMSGKCATCDSTVTWPKHLSVFRCTICLMINDLQQERTQTAQQMNVKDSQRRKCYGCTWLRKLMKLCRSEPVSARD